jgi:hypothetical protein
MGIRTAVGAGSEQVMCLVFGRTAILPTAGGYLGAA